MMSETASTGRATHGGAAVRVVGEGDIALGFDEGEDFVLDPLGVVADMVSYSRPRSEPWASPAAVLDGEWRS